MIINVIVNLNDSDKIFKEPGNWNQFFFKSKTFSKNVCRSRTKAA